MSKLAVVPVLFGIACLMAGAYGAIHNQISYTVSPEYFTDFKFHQFQVPRSMPERVGAAVVGWQAAWWMGIVIGILLIPYGLTIPGTGNTFRGMLRAFLAVLLTTMLFGLVALGLSFVFLDAQTPVAGAPITARHGNQIEDPAAFMRAGTMHNFSYLGGFAGIIAGGIVVALERRRAVRAESSTASSTHVLGPNPADPEA